LTCLCSRLTKLIWIWIKLNQIWWHKLFWLNWFTSFLKERRVCDSLAINDHMFSLILLIKWINAIEWAIDSLAIQQSYVLIDFIDLLLRMCQNWLELVNDLVEIWSKSDSDMIQHLFSFLASSNQLLLSSK